MITNQQKLILFFFNDTATTEIYTLSLHDALPISEEQRLLQKSVREFAESEVRPLAKELDETGHFPRALFKKTAGLGLTGVAAPKTGRAAGLRPDAYTIRCQAAWRSRALTRGVRCR